MKIMSVGILCFTMAACSLTELGTVQKDEYNGVWTGPSVSSPTSKAVTYISAFDYPQGYDWMADPDRGAVKCSLVVFRDGVPTLKVPVGNEYRVGPDPDMHRIIDGHLYTDYSTEEKTIIKKDGKPLMEYPSPEMLCDFKVLTGDVYTLGHSRSGKGFSFRVNGEVVLERDTGYTFERIFIEDSIASIAFAEQLISVDGVFERYYVMSGGKVSQVAVRDDVQKVWDIMIYKDKVVYLASVTGLSMPVLVSEKGMIALSMPSLTSVVSCRMNPLDDDILIEGVISNGRQLQCSLWNSSGKYTLFPIGMTFSAFYVADDALHCALNPASGGDTGLIFRGGETLGMPIGYSCMSRNAMGFSSGMLYIGLSSLMGGKPVLWSDGLTEEIDVNGYISCVAFEQL